VAPAAGGLVVNAPVRLRGVNLLGAKVRLQVGRHCCGGNIAIIHPASSEHAGELKCESCGQRRAWLTHETAVWLQKVKSIFGAPEIITIRPRTSFLHKQEETAATASVNATATETGVQHG
jgi:hypothetical protein